MRSRLDSAVAAANSIRFSDDRIISKSGLLSIEHVRNSFYRDELKISVRTSPRLFATIRDVCSRLQIPEDSVDAFVFASSDIQAYCILGAENECIIRFSSAMINLLDEDELKFVVGHELGHFLLGHGNASSSETRNASFFRAQRAREISADRIGLIASGSVQVAARAIMKTISGLDSRHLTFDVSELLDQLSRISGVVSPEPAASTHPPMILRCKALLWFSMTQIIGSYPNAPDATELSTLDGRVKRDLNRVLDATIDRQIESLRCDLSLWITIQRIFEIGSFDKIRQEKMQEMFGLELVLKVKTFLTSMDSADLAPIIQQRISENRVALEDLTSSEKAEAAYKDLNKRASSF